MNKTQEEILSAYLPSLDAFIENRNSECVFQLTFIGVDRYDEIVLHHAWALTRLSELSFDVTVELNNFLKKKHSKYLYTDKYGTEFALHDHFSKFFNEHLTGIPELLRIPSTSIFSKKGTVRQALGLTKHTLKLTSLDLYIQPLFNPAFPKLNKLFNTERTKMFGSFILDLPKMLGLKKEVLDMQAFKSFDTYLRKRCFAPAGCTKEDLKYYLEPRYLHHLVAYYEEMERNIYIFID